MKLIRYNIFETNSSSTNSLWIGNSNNIHIPEKLTLIDLDWVGRDFCYTTVEERFAVLASLCYETRKFLSLCYKIYEMGVKEIILPNPENFPYLGENKEPELGRGETDDCQEELEELFEPGHEEDLKHFIFDNDTILEGRDDNYDYD